MANIPQLADATLRMKHSLASHVGMPLAARKVVNGKGITNDADVKRLVRKIMSELRSRKSLKKGLTNGHR